MTVHYEIPVEPEKHECAACGRDSGHHLNCPNSFSAPLVMEKQPEPGKVGPDEIDPTEVVSCLAEGCQDAPKPYGGRGPRPKYCAAHGK